MHYGSSYGGYHVYHHAMYHHAAYASAAPGGWLGHMVISAVIHSIVWHMLAPVFHALGPVGSIVVGAIVLGGAFLFMRRRQAYA